VNRDAVRSVPIPEWPTAERAAWELACRPGERLKRGGPASHMKPVTRDDLARRYGYFLDHLARAGTLDLAASAGIHVTKENVERYLAELQARVRSVTQYGNIYKLRRVTELIAPQRELAWLKELEQDLELAKQPRSKFGRAPLTEVLVAAGLTLMAEAEAATHLTLGKRARQFRNGLMLALLALCPIRLKNFSSLELGRNFLEVADRWWIVLTGDETKEKRADERRVPDVLASSIDRYVAEYRKVLAGGAAPSHALWLSRNDGNPMCYSSVARAVEDTTLLALGLKVSTHMFRTSAATSAALHAGDLPHFATAILHHTDPKVTHEHYVRASSISAGQAYASIIDSYLGYCTHAT
jgi:integrase